LARSGVITCQHTGTGEVGYRNDIELGPDNWMGSVTWTVRVTLRKADGTEIESTDKNFDPY
jgi:hypothetical protein